MVDWISAKALQFLPEYAVFEDLFQEHLPMPIVIFLFSLDFLWKKVYNNFLECNWKQEKACRKEAYQEMFRKKKKEKWNQFIRDKI